MKSIRLRRHDFLLFFHKIVWYYFMDEDDISFFRERGELPVEWLQLLFRQMESEQYDEFYRLIMGLGKLKPINPAEVNRFISIMLLQEKKKDCPAPPKKKPKKIRNIVKVTVPQIGGCPPRQMIDPITFHLLLGEKSPFLMNS